MSSANSKKASKNKYIEGDDSSITMLQTSLEQMRREADASGIPFDEADFIMEYMQQRREKKNRTSKTNVPTQRSLYPCISYKDTLEDESSTDDSSESESADSHIIGVENGNEVKTRNLTLQQNEVLQKYSYLDDDTVTTAPTDIRGLQMTSQNLLKKQTNISNSSKDVNQTKAQESAREVPVVIPVPAEIDLKSRARALLLAQQKIREAENERNRATTMYTSHSATATASTNNLYTTTSTQDQKEYAQKMEERKRTFERARELLGRTSSMKQSAALVKASATPTTPTTTTPTTTTTIASELANDENISSLKNNSDNKTTTVPKVGLATKAPGVPIVQLVKKEIPLSSSSAHISPTSKAVVVLQKSGESGAEAAAKDEEEEGQGGGEMPETNTVKATIQLENAENKESADLMKETATQTSPDGVKTASKDTRLADLVRQKRKEYDAVVKHKANQETSAAYLAGKDPITSSDPVIARGLLVAKAKALSESVMRKDKKLEVNGSTAPDSKTSSSNGGSGSGGDGGGVKKSNIITAITVNAPPATSVHDDTTTTSCADAAEGYRSKNKPRNFALLRGCLTSGTTALLATPVDEAAVSATARLEKLKALAAAKKDMGHQSDSSEESEDDEEDEDEDEEEDEEEEESDEDDEKEDEEEDEEDEDEEEEEEQIPEPSKKNQVKPSANTRSSASPRAGRPTAISGFIMCK